MVGRRGSLRGGQTVRPLRGLPLLPAEHPDPLPLRATTNWKERTALFIRSRFEDTHKQRYNFELPDSPLEIATLRVVGRGTIAGVTLTESENGSR